jgi:hypothetical protein
LSASPQGENAIFRDNFEMLITNIVPEGTHVRVRKCIKKKCKNEDMGKSKEG